jgi:predicted phosphatase
VSDFGWDGLQKENFLTDLTQKNAKNNMIFLFDLDLTIWETKNKNGLSIWAKQMIPPLQFDGKDAVQDDVYSICKLKRNFRDYINSLNQSGHKVGFISNSMYFGLPIEIQPVTLLMKEFDLDRYFNYVRILLYKTKSKIPSLIKIANQATSDNESVIFFDDNEDILNDARLIKGLKVIDSKSISDWNDFK